MNLTLNVKVSFFLLWSSTSQTLVCLLWVSWGDCSRIESYWAGQAWGLGFCISNRFPDDTNAPGPWSTLRVAQVWSTWLILVSPMSDARQLCWELPLHSPGELWVPGKGRRYTAAWLEGCVLGCTWPLVSGGIRGTWADTLQAPNQLWIIRSDEVGKKAPLQE